MSKKKKVKAPVYEQFQDNEYISGLRQDLPQYRDLTNKLLYSLDVTSPEVQQQMQNVANDYTQSMWNDLSRQYLQDYNALNQRNYNRFGSLGSTGALYGQESLQRDYNDQAARLASATASQYQNLMNNYYNQKLQSFGAAAGLYDTAGANTTNIDLSNWNIRNKNIEAQYVADIQNAQRNNWLGGALSGAVSGAGTGFASGGPWGALIGGVAGAGLGAYAGSQGANIGQSSQLGSSLGTGLVGSMADSGNITWLNTKKK